MADENQKKELDEKACAFCLSSENNWLELGAKKDLQNVVTHYNCLLLSSEMVQRGDDNEGILGFLLPDIKKELARGKKQKCKYCNRHGATIRCVVPKCKKEFHLPCGIKNKSLHQFYGHFKSFCGTHRPVQKVPSELLSELATGLPCGVCLEELPRVMCGETLWTPCCRMGAWFHRQCAQRLAFSAGYFFKCPLCNDKEKFNKTMRECGIFIPEQDASWETVPNAFEELLHRHSSCDHPACRDPLGRTNNVRGTRWEVILCDTCGSQGVHMACGQLSWSKPEFECDICEGSRLKAATRARPMLEPVKDSDSDSSDQESQESRPCSQPSSPPLDIRVDSPDMFASPTHFSKPISPPLMPEEGTTPPYPPSMCGPFPPQPTRRRTARGRPPLQKSLPVVPSPAQLPSQTPVLSPVVYSSNNVFVALQHPTVPPKYNLYEPDPAAAAGSSVLSEFTVVGSHVFPKPKSFSESVSITPPLPPLAVRVLNQSPTKVSTTERSTLFPQSQSRMIPITAAADIIDLIEDSDDDIEIIEDKASATRELVTHDGAKIPVVKVGMTATVASSADRGSPDIEIIESLSVPPSKPKMMYAKRTFARKTTSARSQENLSPLRLALELPLAPGQTAPAVPEPRRMLAPRRVREILPTPQFVDQTARSRQTVGTEWNATTTDVDLEIMPLPSRQASASKPGQSANDAKFVATSTSNREVLEVGLSDARQGNWPVQTTTLPKRVRLSRDPPSYEETMKNDKSQVRFLPVAGDSAEAAGGPAPAASYLITNPSANLGTLLDGGNIFTISRTSVASTVSSYMLTPVGSAYIRPAAAQSAMSVGGNDPGSRHRGIECDAGSSANADGPTCQTASAACARSERQTIGEARQATASKAIGSADLPRSDNNRLINLSTVSFKILQTNLVKMTEKFKENFIPLTTPDKKNLIPVKPTVFFAESDKAVKVEPLVAPRMKLKRAKRGAAFLRPDDASKPRRRRGRSSWSKGLIKQQKKKVYTTSISTESSSSIKLETMAMSPIDEIPASSSSLSAAAGVSSVGKSQDVGYSRMTERGTPTARKSSLPRRTPAPKTSPATQDGPATRHSTVDSCLTKLSVKKQLFAMEQPIPQGNPRKQLFALESPGKSNLEEQTVANDANLVGTSGSPASKQRMSSDGKMHRFKKLNAVSARGQCLTRRTRSVMKAASYSTRSKLSLQKYNFKEGSNEFVPLLRKGYIPKKLQSAGISPKVSMVTNATQNFDTEASQSSSSVEHAFVNPDSQKKIESAGMSPNVSMVTNVTQHFNAKVLPSSSSVAAVNPDSQESEVESKTEESSFSDSFVSCINKVADINNDDGVVSDGLQPDVENRLESMLKESSLDDLISDDEDFLSSQDDDDSIDNEDDLVFIKRTMKEYKKINQISTVKAKALTARKFRPASDTEKMQREMLLKLREMPSTILHPQCDL